MRIPDECGPAVNLAGQLVEALRRTPHGVAFQGSRAGITRGALADASVAVSAALHARGLRAGDTVALAVRPGPQALATVLGATRIGLRVALVDPGAGPELVTARLRTAQAALVIADALVQAASTWAAVPARRAGLSLPRLDRIAPVLTLGRRIPGSAPALLTGAGRDPGPATCGSATGGSADALVIFTSGTTGRPRAVVHTHAGLAAGVDVVRSLVDPLPGRPVVGSTFFVMAPALLAGAPVRLPPRRPRALAALFAAALNGSDPAARPQACYLTPPQTRALLAERPRLCGRFFAGSAPVPAALLRRVVAAGAEQATGVYAMTEAFPIAAVHEPEKSGYTGPGDLLGTPLPGVRVETDGAGQLLVGGPMLSDRYLGEEPHTRVATGDRGELRQGRVLLHGRIKEMILRRAENIYPGLYEPALHVPGVASALLVGVPAAGHDPAGDRGPGDGGPGDAQGEEDLVLLIETEPGASERQVRQRLRDPLRDMGSARPDRIVFGRVPTGGRSRKPDRVAAAAMLARR